MGECLHLEMEERPPLQMEIQERQSLQMEIQERQSLQMEIQNPMEIQVCLEMGMIEQPTLLCKDLKVKRMILNDQELHEEEKKFRSDRRVSISLIDKFSCDLVILTSSLFTITKP